MIRVVRVAWPDEGGLRDQAAQDVEALAWLADVTCEVLREQSART